MSGKEQDENDLPLAGLTVLDLTTLLPGPLATLMLAQAGARVIKVERPGGEDMRQFPPFVDGRSVLFEQLNSGKERLELDLKDPAAKAELFDLLETSDILVEQFRPGVMGRLGLGFSYLQSRFPGLIYCSISGYGQTGERATMAGHDLNYLAMSGLLAQSCGTASAPVLPPTQIADIGGGSLPAVTNILLAVLKRQKTGKGCHLDIAMSDAMFTFGLFAHAQHTSGNKVPEFGQGLLTGGSPRYRLYPARDGRLVAVAALEEKFWQRLCDLLDIPQALRGGGAAPEDSAAALADAFSQRDAADWAPLLHTADCCATVVATFDEARADAAFVNRGLFDRKVAMSGADIDAAVLPLVPAVRKST